MTKQYIKRNKKEQVDDSMVSGLLITYRNIYEKTIIKVKNY